MRSIIFQISVLGFSAALVYLLFYLQNRPAGIVATPPEKYAANPVHLVSDGNFQQNDPQWKHIRLGRTQETIGGVGCTLSSVAMALKNMGYDFTPKSLNTAVTGVEGYTDRGWLQWSSLEKVTDDRVKADYYTEPDHDILDACLRRGDYPIVKFMIKGVIPHWVIVTGRNAKDYLVRDPLVNSPAPIKLSTRTGRILAVRCIGDKWVFHP